MGHQRKPGGLPGYLTEWALQHERAVTSEAEKMNKAVSGLATMAASQLATLLQKVDELGKTRSCPPDTLERKVEELSGQLVSLAQQSRQQQGLLGKIWEKVSTPPPPSAAPCPCLGPGRARAQGQPPWSSPCTCARVQGGQRVGCARTDPSHPTPTTASAAPTGSPTTASVAVAAHNRPAVAATQNRATSSPWSRGPVPAPTSSSPEVLRRHGCHPPSIHRRGGR